MLNNYFRFSQLNGKKIGNLQVGIPSFRSSYSAPPAEIIEREEIDLLLNAIDRSTPVGKRTYASILCLIDLCMRIGEVGRIKLDDIDWRNGRIRVYNNKAREPYWLPLPKWVGQAIADYLKMGGPSQNVGKYSSPISGGEIIREKEAIFVTKSIYCGRKSDSIHGFPVLTYCGIMAQR